MSDPYASSVSLLVYGDAGSPTIVDHSGLGLVLTGSGGVTNSTTDSKYGGSSVNIASTGDSLTVPTGTALVLGSGDFTIEMWANLSTISGLYGNATSGSPQAGAIAFSATSGMMNFAVGSQSIFTSGLTIGAGWHHYAVSRVGATGYVFLDGVLINSGSASSWSATATDTTYIGAMGTVNKSVGYFDDVRITKGVGRYTATFAPPTQIQAPGSATVAITAPSAVATAYGGGSAQMTLPKPTVFAAAGGNAQLVSPSAFALLTGHNTTGERSFGYTMTAPTLVAFGGANASLTMTAPQLALGATVTGWGGSDIAAPSATVSAAGTAWGLAQAALTFGSPGSTYDLVGYSGAVVSVTLTGRPTVVATGTAGGAGGAAITLPLFNLVASGIVNALSHAEIVAPSARLGAQAQAWMLMPTATLVATGTAVVVATYEAYAVNLNHTPAQGVVPVDETTHYTNYPFDRIVRYKNSYYGMNSTGLYLLEGTTDFDAVTPAAPPWSVKTAETDFKSAQLKTVEVAYFGGRMAPASTVSLYAGEGAAQAYPYTTPRGELAQNHRQIFGKGVRARYYSLGIAGSGELTIDSITLNVTTLSRKI